MAQEDLSIVTAIHLKVNALRQGTFPNVVMKMPSGWLVLGDPQVLPGYCLLLPDPVVPHLNALSQQARQIFLADMALAGDAILKVTGCVRINYELLGNLEPALHAHIIPRYDDEEEGLKIKPIWFYDWQKATPYSRELHDGLRLNIQNEITRLVHGTH